MRRKLHPLVNLFPQISGQERDRLKQSIRLHGVAVPVLLWRDQIIDGRHRAEIAEELGLDYPTQQYDGDEASLIGHVMALNFRRRHLSASQRAAIAVQANLLLERYRNRNGQAGRPRQEKGAHATHRPRGTARNEVAALCGTNPRYIDQCRTIQDADPHLLDEVAEGKLSIPRALKRIDPRPVNRPSADQRNQNHAVDPNAAPTDAFGHVLPPNLIAVFEQVNVFDELVKALHHLNKLVRQASRGAAGVCFEAEGTLTLLVKDLIAEAKAKCPYTICPKCRGKQDECQDCHQSGWMSRDQYQTMPEKLKEAWGVPS